MEVTPNPSSGETPASPIRKQRPLLLTGEHDLNIDEKNRLLIPIDIRNLINPERDGSALYLVPGMNRTLWIYPEFVYLDMYEKLPTTMTPRPEVLEFFHLTFAMASKVELDKQFRVLIPEKTMARMQLTKEVTLIGTGDHLEIWNRPSESQYMDELYTRYPEVASKFREIREAGMNGKPVA